MKPLAPAPLTNEDFWIWDAVVSRCASNGIAHHGLAMVSDRRDAALMLKLVQARVAWRALYACFGPLVNGAGFDQVGEGPGAVPMPALRL